ncbi:hypothetical protein IF2G_03903 [Cordyceps javanica]|nr:hypothetical protein IF2G_03903 [Cordyceps javanica]
MAKSSTRRLISLSRAQAPAGISNMRQANKRAKGASQRLGLFLYGTQSHGASVLFFCTTMPQRSEKKAV